MVLPTEVVIDRAARDVAALVMDRHLTVDCTGVPNEGSLVPGRTSLVDDEIGIVLHNGKVLALPRRYTTVPNERPLVCGIASLVENEIAIGLHNGKALALPGGIGGPIGRALITRVAAVVEDEIAIALHKYWRLSETRKLFTPR